MTGRNRALNAARNNGRKRPRQLLRKEKLADGNPFLHLTAHANGRPLYDPFTTPLSFVDGHVSFLKMYWNGVPALEGFPFFYEPPGQYHYKWWGN
jgi:hypothetical protein